MYTVTVYHVNGAQSQLTNVTLLDARVLASTFGNPNAVITFHNTQRTNMIRVVNVV